MNINFAVVSKNSTRYRSQNNCVERLSVDDNVAKSFNTLANSLNVPLNYFNVQTNLFDQICI